MPPHSSPSPPNLVEGENSLLPRKGPASRHTASLIPNPKRNALDADLPNRTGHRICRRIGGPARRFPGWPGPAAPPRSSGPARLAYLRCPALRPARRPATRSFSGWLWGSGLALPSTLWSTSVLEMSPTRRRRPGPALYGRKDFRKLL